MRLALDTKKSRSHTNLAVVERLFMRALENEVQVREGNVQYSLKSKRKQSLLSKKPIQLSQKDYAKLRQSVTARYAGKSDIPTVDNFYIAEYNQVNVGYEYYIRNTGKGDFTVLSKRRIVKTIHDLGIKEVNHGEHRTEVDSSVAAEERGRRQRIDTGSSRLSGDGGATLKNDRGVGANPNDGQGRNSFGNTGSQRRIGKLNNSVDESSSQLDAESGFSNAQNEQKAIINKAWMQGDASVDREGNTLDAGEQGPKKRQFYKKRERGTDANQSEAAVEKLKEHGEREAYLAEEGNDTSSASLRSAPSPQGEGYDDAIDENGEPDEERLKQMTDERHAAKCEVKSREQIRGG